MKERLAQVEKVQQQALECYRKELEGAKDPQGQRGAMDRYVAEVHENTTAVLGLVREHPEDPAAAEALRFVIRTARGGPGNESDQALELLRRDHARDPKMGTLCEQIFYFFTFPNAEAFLRAVLEHNPSPQDRGFACHALATYLRYQARMLRHFKEKPETIREYEPQWRIEVIRRLLREKDPDALDGEADRLLERVISEFGSVRSALDDVPPPFSSDERTLGEVAAGELFAARHLAVGKVAPDIEGRDVEGKPFKLSDERGKVIVLTFSGNW